MKTPRKRVKSASDALQKHSQPNSRLVLSCTFSFYLIPFWLELRLDPFVGLTSASLLTPPNQVLRAEKQQVIELYISAGVFHICLHIPVPYAGHHSFIAMHYILDFRAHIIFFSFHSYLPFHPTHFCFLSKAHLHLLVVVVVAVVVVVRVQLKNVRRPFGNTATA
jgi:hypothetical protein